MVEPVVRREPFAAVWNCISRFAREVVAVPPTRAWFVVVDTRTPEPLKKVQFTSDPLPPPDVQVGQVNIPVFGSYERGDDAEKRDRTYVVKFVKYSPNIETAPVMDVFCSDEVAVVEVAVKLAAVVVPFTSSFEFVVLAVRPIRTSSFTCCGWILPDAGRSHGTVIADAKRGTMSREAMKRDLK